MDSNHQTSKLAMVQLYADILLLIMLELQDDLSSLHSCILVKSFKSRRNKFVIIIVLVKPLNYSYGSTLCRYSFIDYARITR
ncbi:unnamed protein product [Rhizophagus irregularis]|uniref:Uncharacterized protein n=1 Tax=Rhizophagus irregularis TaxID=588596 RepID=A0A915ZDY4_9GLOM|nr:unnamed protein product [Rhizophagus irregularis]